jgi:hypothetical protein
LKLIRHFKAEYAVIRLEIHLLTIHLQKIEQEKEKLLNKIREKLRKEKKKNLIENFTARIQAKKQEQEKTLELLRREEKKMSVEFTDGCKCKADFMRKIAALERKNAVIDVEINLLTKYYQNEKLLSAYYEGILLS